MQTPPPPRPKTPPVKVSVATVTNPGYVPEVDVSKVCLIKKKSMTESQLTQTEKPQKPDEVETIYPVDEYERKSDGLPMPKLADDDFEIEYAQLDDHEKKMTELKKQRTLLQQMAEEDDAINEHLKE